MLTTNKREQFSATRSAIYVCLPYMHICYICTHIVLKTVMYVHTHIDIQY